MKKKVLEAALFLSSGPMSVGDLINITDCSAKEFEREISELREKYGEGSGIRLIESNQTFQLIVNPEVLPKVKQLSPYRDLSPGLVKALSVIAFKGPIKQSTLVNTIGNRVYEYAHELERRGLITAKRDGRTKVLKITKLFEDYFGKEPEQNNLERFLKQEGVLEKETSTEAGPQGERKAQKKGRGRKKRQTMLAADGYSEDKLKQEQELLEDAERARDAEEGFGEPMDAPEKGFEGK